MPASEPYVKRTIDPARVAAAADRSAELLAVARVTHPDEELRRLLGSIEGSVFVIGNMAAFAQELADNGDHEEASKHLGSHNAEAIDEVSARITKELHRYHGQ